MQIIIKIYLLKDFHQCLKRTPIIGELAQQLTACL